MKNAAQSAGNGPVMQRPRTRNGKARLLTIGDLDHRTAADSSAPSAGSQTNITSASDP